MSIYQLAVVAIGGFFGAIARFQISQKLNKNLDERFPYGTLLVNLIGAFLLGLISSFSLEKIYILLLGTGFLGAFTTFSTLNKELFSLQKVPRKWLIYFTATYVGGLFLGFLGYFIGK